MRHVPKSIYAACLALASLTANSGVVTEGTQGRSSASERVPLVSLVMPALQQLGESDSVAAGCFALLSDPTVKLRGEVEVTKKGNTVSSEVNDFLSINAGKIIGCSAVIAARSEEISQTLRKVRPTRAQAVDLVKQAIGPNLAGDYAKWQDSNQQAYDTPVMIAKDNNGHSREYIAYNDVVIEVERQQTEASSGSVGSAKELKWKTLVDGGENTVREKAGNIREIITDGVYSWFTQPTTVQSSCAAPGGASKPCQETYSVKFDGMAVDVRKNGQRWFDGEVIGGAIYAIELSGEKSTSTTKKVERR